MVHHTGPKTRHTSGISHRRAAFHQFVSSLVCEARRHRVKDDAAVTKQPSAPLVCPTLKNHLEERPRPLTCIFLEQKLHIEFYAFLLPCWCSSLRPSTTFQKSSSGNHWEVGAKVSPAERLKVLTRFQSAEVTSRPSLFLRRPQFVKRLKLEADQRQLELTGPSPSFLHLKTKAQEKRVTLLWAQNGEVIKVLQHKHPTHTHTHILLRIYSISALRHPTLRPVRTCQESLAAANGSLTSRLSTSCCRRENKTLSNVVHVVGVLFRRAALLLSLSALVCRRRRYDP